MKKNKVSSLLIVGGLLLCFFFLGKTVVSSDIRTATFNMFESIDELDILKPYVICEIQSDKQLYGLTCKDKFIQTVEWENGRFEVYAYEFDTVADCAVYYERVASSWNGLAFGWHINGNGVTSTKATIYYENCIMHVVGESQNETIAFLEWVTSDFTHSVK